MCDDKQAGIFRQRKDSGTRNNPLNGNWRVLFGVALVIVLAFAVRVTSQFDPPTNTHTHTHTRPPTLHNTRTHTKVDIFYSNVIISGHWILMPHIINLYLLGMIRYVIPQNTGSCLPPTKRRACYNWYKSNTGCVEVWTDTIVGLMTLATCCVTNFYKNHGAFIC